MKNLLKSLKYDKFNLAFFIKFLDNFFFILNIIIIIFIILSILLFVLNLFGPIIYCAGDLDKFIETTKEVVSNTNSNISENNVYTNVSNSNSHIQNSNTNISNTDTDVENYNTNESDLIETNLDELDAELNSLGINASELPNDPMLKSAILYGGIINGVLITPAIRPDSIVQNEANNNNNNSDNNGPFSAKSIIEEGDYVNNIINFIYYNLFVSVCIFLLLILSIYLYRNINNISEYVTLVFFNIFNTISIYLVYNLLENINVILIIYQNSINNFYFKKYYIDINEIKRTKFVSLANMKSKILLLSKNYWIMFLLFFIKIYSYINKSNTI